jgi:hypothetical protein
MSEKESLVDIFQRLYSKYADKGDNPDPNENGFFEMKKAANEYASSLLPLGDQWKTAVEYDIKRLNDNYTIPHSIRINIKRLEHYKSEAGDLIVYIRESLLSHGFNIKELPKETLDYLNMGAFADIVKEWQRISEIQRQKRKAARKKTKAQATATDASQKATPADIKPATDGGSTQTKPEETSIFTDCIANAYRDKQEIIEAELKKVLADKKGKAAIIVFVACYINGIIRQCPSHQQAFEQSKSIGIAHKGYNDQKKKYFKESEEGTRIYDVLLQSKLDIIREEIIKAEVELKALFDTLGIEINDIN